MNNNNVANLLLLAQFSGIWEVFSLFTALSFTSSEVDELEKSNCRVKLGISLFIFMIEFNVNSHLGEKNASDLLSHQRLYSLI